MAYRFSIRALAAMSLGLFVSLTAAVRGDVAGGPWIVMDHMPPTEALTDPWIRPVQGQALFLDIETIKKTLAAAPFERTPAAAKPLEIAVPDPSGALKRFAIVEYAVMEPALAAAHPEIKTYYGQGVDDPASTIVCATTLLGFQATVRSPEGMWFVDPYTRNNVDLYTSYYKQDAEKEEKVWQCLTPGGGPTGAAPTMRLRSTISGTLRTYRFALSYTGEMTTWVGSAATAQSLAATQTNQINGIYQNDLAVRFVLVANNNNVIYTSASTDPYTSPNNASTTNTNLQSALDSVIGSANYDIGHVIHRTTSGNNGLAGGIGTVCVAGTKGKGYSAHSNPNTSTFVVDYVCHELGHQCGGRHNFNNCGGSQGDSASLAVEAGSGTTIMSYAGICGSTNVQANSDAYFNGLNIQQMYTFLSGSATCSTNTATGNTAPTISAGPAYTIPSKTPFVLTATGSDPNGDAVTYSWEQQDGGALVTYPPTTATDNGTCPLVRSRTATTDPTRTVPPLANVLANSFNAAEMMPQVARSMKWRVTARDNKAGGGGINQADVTYTVVGTAGPFQITSPNAAGTFSGPVTVTWAVANTSSAPINCANVKISLSTDGGSTFPTVLAASTPNTGSANVVLPSLNSTTARIKIEAVGNIFFDISNANFTIMPSTPVASFASGGATTIADNVGNGNANGSIDPGESQILLTIPVQNVGNTTATGVSGTLTSSTGTASIVTGVSAYANLAAGATASNASAFVISVSPSHPCGSPINLSLAMTSGQGSSAIPITLSTGQTSGSSNITVAYTGAAVSIPDATAAGININLPASGVGTISDVNFRFNGTSCSTTATSTTVGLNHSYVGDLIVTLTSPQGTSVVLMNRPGSGTGTTAGSSGNNFCNTVLDDDGAFSPIQNIAAAGAPYTGTFLPANPLSAFDGQNADGTWVLNVSDNLANDTGSVRAFSLVFTNLTVGCTPPSSTTGACCVPSGACTATTSGACSGSYQGNGTACSPNPCPQPTGACCVASSGACSVATSAACAGAGNSYQGDGTSCSPNPCPQPLGACCAAIGSCTQTTSAGCAGSYLGNGSACSPNPCPQPSGSCCAADGSCSVTIQSGCSGTWSLAGVCSPNPCPQPVGTCCIADGSCSVTTESACSATWTNGASCTPVNPCPQPSGSCCATDGSCTITQQVTCTGAWASGGICLPNPCPQPTGACCGFDGSCSITTAAACSASYQGDNTSCSPNNCPQPQIEVSVIVTGIGSGVVLSTTGPINCPGTCSAFFTQNTNVTLVAVAAVNSKFLGWSGACTGTGNCSNTSATSYSVTATFTCRADYNNSNSVELQDIFDFLNGWFAGNPAADFNGNGVSLQDIFDFLNAWFAGC